MSKSDDWETGKSSGNQWKFRKWMVCSRVTQMQVTRTNFVGKKRTNFFVTFFFLKCYIVERGKMPVGDAGRKAAAGAEFRKGGKQIWIMSFL